MYTLCFSLGPVLFFGFKTALVYYFLTGPGAASLCPSFSGALFRFFGRSTRCFGVCTAYSRLSLLCCYTHSASLSPVSEVAMCMSSPPLLNSLKTYAGITYYELASSRFVRVRIFLVSRLLGVFWIFRYLAKFACEITNPRCMRLELVGVPISDKRGLAYFVCTRADWEVRIRATGWLKM